MNKLQVHLTLLVRQWVPSHSTMYRNVLTYKQEINRCCEINMSDFHQHSNINMSDINQYSDISIQHARYGIYKYT